MTNELGITSENNRLVVSSRKVEEVFEKLHKHVMESIRELNCGEEFNETNFWPVKYRDAKGEMRPKTLPEALRLAASLKEKCLVLEAKIEHDAPYTALGKTITAYIECLTFCTELNHRISELLDMR